MNLKTVIASLVLGSSSLAMASPSVTFHASAQGSYGTTVVRDRVDPDCDEPAPIAQPNEQPYDGRAYNQSYDQPDEQPYTQPYAQPATYPQQGGFWRGGRWLPSTFRPVVLASGMHFSNDGRTFINVGPQAGRFSTLQISAASGRPFITQVYVQFANGQEQVIRNLDRTLAGNRTLTLDLDGNRRGIARIVVYGGDIGNGYRWRRASGTFNVIAS